MISERSGLHSKVAQGVVPENRSNEFHKPVEHWTRTSWWKESKENYNVNQKKKNGGQFQGSRIGTVSKMPFGTSVGTTRSVTRVPNKRNLSKYPPFSVGGRQKDYASYISRKEFWTKIYRF